MENNNYFRCILKGTVGTLLFAFSGLIVLSFLMTKLVFSKHMFNVLYLVISLVSLALGALIAARKKQSKGMLVGFGVTVCYSVTICIICMIINGGFSFNRFELVKLIISFIVGGLGGVLGVNIQK